MGPHNSRSCGCRTDQPTVLKVGKAVQVRGRLQSHAYERSGKSEDSPWLWDYGAWPHVHLVQAAVWYVPRWQMATAEVTLIGALKPLMNFRDRFGFVPPDPWPMRPPDQIALITDFEPRRPDPEAPYVRNEPGVYAWFYDAATEERAMDGIVAEIIGRAWAEVSSSDP